MPSRAYCAISVMVWLLLVAAILYGLMKAGMAIFRSGAKAIKGEAGGTASAGIKGKAGEASNRGGKGSHGTKVSSGDSGKGLKTVNKSKRRSGSKTKKDSSMGLQSGSKSADGKKDSGKGSKHGNNRTGAHGKKSKKDSRKKLQIGGNLKRPTAEGHTGPVHVRHHCRSESKVKAHTRRAGRVQSFDRCRPKDPKCTTAAELAEKKADTDPCPIR